MIFKQIISEGHNSVKCRLSYGAPFSAYRPMMVYICTKFHENVLDSIKVIEQTRFLFKKFPRGIIPQKM